MPATSSEFWTKRQLLNRVPAKAGTHLSTHETAEGWVPAFAGTPEFSSRAVCSGLVRFAGRVGGVFRQAGIHVVPGLRAFDEDVGLGAEGAGVVEAADADADDVGPGRYLDI